MKYTKENVELYVSLYNSGMSNRKIGQHLGITKGIADTLNRMAKRDGLIPDKNRTKYDRQTRMNIANDYEHMEAEEVQKKYGVCRSTLHMIAKEFGVQKEKIPRFKGSHAFDSVWDRNMFIFDLRLDGKTKEQITEVLSGMNIYITTNAIHGILKKFEQGYPDVNT